MLYQSRYIKTKIRTYGDKVYTNFRGLNVPKDNIECESFTVLFLFFTCLRKQKYMHVYLGNCAHKIIDKRMIGYLGDNFFEIDKD